jgi:hypothetical protein
MIKIWLIKFHLFIPFLLVSQITVGQNKVAIAGLDLDGDILSWYDQQVGLQNTPLQTGSLNDSERMAKRSHPYFQNVSWVSGTITYREQTYQNVSILYDTYSDQLLVKNSGDFRYSSQPIQLIKDQVSSFSIHGALFEFVSEKIDFFENGFFEIMYRGDDMELIRKRTKLVEIDHDAVDTYREDNKYYLRRMETATRIYRKSSIVRQFPEHKKEIRMFIRKNHIQILKPNTELQLKKLIAYCDTLN